MQGKAIKRDKWQDNFIYLVPADKYMAKTNIAKDFVENDGKVVYLPYIAYKTPQCVAMWKPSHEDILAEDWKDWSMI